MQHYTNNINNNEKQRQCKRRGCKQPPFNEKGESTRMCVMHLEEHRERCKRSKRKREDTHKQLENSQDQLKGECKHLKTQLDSKNKELEHLKLQLDSKNKEVDSVCQKLIKYKEMLDQIKSTHPQLLKQKKNK